MSTVNEDELEGMPDPDHLTRFRVTGVLREEYMDDAEIPEVGDVIKVNRAGRVVSVNRKEGPTSVDAIVVTIKLDDKAAGSS